MVRDPASYLPLKPRLLHVLLALLETPRHGYAIMQRVEERTGGAMVLEPGGLYRTLRGMVADGLIVETDQRPDPEDDDPRRRYYRVTEFGREVAAAETGRLRELLGHAEALAAEPGGAG